MGNAGSNNNTSSDDPVEAFPVETAQVAHNEGLGGGANSDALYSNMEEADEDVHLLSTTLPMANAAAAASDSHNKDPNSSSSNNSNNKPSHDDGPAFAVTTPTHDGEQQACWGCFDDTQAEVLPDNNDNDDVGEIPTVTAHLDDRQIRLAFIRKVYTILACQMLVTFSVCVLMALQKSVRTFALGIGYPLYYANFAIILGSICALHMYKHSYPTNFYLLGVFTVSMSYMVGVITALYTDAGAGELVVEAVFITATVFIILTIFTLQSKWDFSFLGAALGMSLWILILWGLFGMIFGLQTGSVFALFGSILFSLYIIYDTYMIAERLDPEDYIVAAVELYLDIVNLFLFILRLLSELHQQ